MPDHGSGTPNLQTLWLERTLAQARRDPTVDMIVVFMHQCAMSTSLPGNGSDLGIRRAWLPLFDRYEVDLVLSGHEHDYERTYPVRGYDPGAHGTVVSPNPGQTAGEAVDTRRPAVATTQPASVDGVPAWDTAAGHRLPGPRRRRDQRPGQRLRHRRGDRPAPGQGHHPAQRHHRARRPTGFKRNAADSIEDAPWSAATNAGDAYGYAIFDVDPGRRRGETTITMQYFAVPAVTNEAGSAHDGTTTLPTTPFETFVFGRGIRRFSRGAAGQDEPAVAGSAGS